MQDRRFYVYVLFRHDTGAPFYVGKGCGKRLIATDVSCGNRHKDSILAQAKRAGSECPRAVVAAGLPETEAFAVERSLIAALGRVDLKTGMLVNLTDGGEGRSGAIASAESRQKVSAALKGIVRSPETREKMGAAKRGVPKSAEHRAKIGDVQRGKKRGPRPPEVIEKLKRAHAGRRPSDASIAASIAFNTGRVASAETRAKRSAALKGRPRPPEIAEKIAAANRARAHLRRGVKQSPESIALRRSALKGRPLSPEHRAKISEARRRRFQGASK